MKIAKIELIIIPILVSLNKGRPRHTTLAIRLIVPGANPCLPAITISIVFITNILMPRSAFVQRNRNRNDNQLNFSNPHQTFEPPINMMLQLTRSLKVERPKYYNKPRPKKNFSSQYNLQK